MLLDINGKSILERQISSLREQGVDKIFIVTGYKKERHIRKDVEYFFNPKYSETDQLGSLMIAREKIFGDVLIIFGDIIFDCNILQQVLASNDDISIAIDLDWEKSYDERSDNPKSLADKVLIEDKKVTKISAKEISLEQKNEVGEFLGIIKLSADGSKIFIKKYEELEKTHRGRSVSYTHLTLPTKA